MGPPAHCTHQAPTRVRTYQQHQHKNPRTTQTRASICRGTTAHCLTQVMQAHPPDPQPSVVSCCWPAAGWRQWGVGATRRGWGEQGRQLEGPGNRPPLAAPEAQRPDHRSGPGTRRKGDTGGLSALQHRAPCCPHPPSPFATGHQLRQGPHTHAHTRTVHSVLWTSPVQVPVRRGPGVAGPLPWCQHHCLSAAAPAAAAAAGITGATHSLRTQPRSLHTTCCHTAAKRTHTHEHTHAAYIRLPLWTREGRGAPNTYTRQACPPCLPPSRCIMALLWVLGSLALLQVAPLAPRRTTLQLLPVGMHWWYMCVSSIVARAPHGTPCPLMLQHPPRCIRGPGAPPCLGSMHSRLAPTPVQKGAAAAAKGRPRLHGV